MNDLKQISAELARLSEKWDVHHAAYCDACHRADRAAANIACQARDDVMTEMNDLTAPLSAEEHDIINFGSDDD